MFLFSLFTQLTGSQESMLRVEQDDPFSDIFYYGPTLTVSTIEETSTIVVSTHFSTRLFCAVMIHRVRVFWYTIAVNGDEGQNENEVKVIDG